MRSAGYYWVKYDGAWEIARYDDWGYWHTIGQVDGLTDIIWEEIDENPIYR